MSLRNRIMEEARAASPRKRTKYTQAYRWEGQGTFDLNNGMEELFQRRPNRSNPSTVSRARALAEEFQDAELCREQAAAFVTPQPLSEQAAPAEDLVMQELDAMLDDLKEKRAIAEAAAPQEVPRHQSANLIPDAAIHPQSCAPHPLFHGGTIAPSGIDRDAITLASQEELVGAAKGIYTDLVDYQVICIESDKGQRWSLHSQDQRPSHLHDPAQYHAHEDLRRTLLHHYRDFFAVSQHSQAPPALKLLAEKYFMPDRMYRHGIGDFLELYADMGSRQQIVGFAKNAYSLVAFLQGSMPTLSHQFQHIASTLQDYVLRLENLPTATMPFLDGLYLDASLSSTATTSPSTSDVDSIASTSMIKACSWELHRSRFKAGCWDSLYWDDDLWLNAPSVSLFQADVSGWLHLPDTLQDALLGWLYFGREMVCQSFPLYCKVFQFLVLTAKHRGYWASVFSGVWK